MDRQYGEKLMRPLRQRESDKSRASIEGGNTECGEDGGEFNK